MDLGLVGVILTIVFGIVAIISIVVAVRLSRRKIPSFAYRTNKVVGLGSNAPPELKLLFADKQVNDVYRTKFIFFNRGREPIRSKDDIVKPIIVRFANAQILREPLVSPSSNDIDFVAKRVSDTIEIGFKYLDYQDGAVVEVMHTSSDKPDCQGKIMQVEKISNLGTLNQSTLNSRERAWAIIAGLALMCVIPLFIIDEFLAHTRWIMFITAILAGALGGIGFPYMIPLIARSKFPSWSHQDGDS
jgi:hypothetical protein